MTLSTLKGLRPSLAATEFARAWAAYAAIEWLFSVIVPWFTRPSYAYLRPHLGFSLFLLAFYPLAGFLLGVACNRALNIAGHGPAERTDIRTQKARALGSLSVVSIFGVHLIVQSGLQVSLAAVFFACGVLILGSTISVLSNRWSGRLSSVVSPWTASVLVIGVAWLTRDFLFASSRTVKLSAAGAYMLAIVPFAWLVGTPVRSEGPVALPRRWLSRFRFPAYLPILAFVALIAGVALTQQPKITDVPSSAARPRQPLPDVLLIVLDTVRADHLSVSGYGRDTTPNLRAFAQHATVYPRAVSTSNMTLPSHASLFTGLYPSTHGAHFAPNLPLGRSLAPEADTIAEVLARAGYQTTAVVANHSFPGPAFLLDQGFEHYDQRAPVRFIAGFELYTMNAVAKFLAWAFPSLDRESPFFTAGEVNEALFSKVAAGKANERPQFLFLNYMDAHWPYLPPAPFDTLYPGKDPTFTRAKQRRVIEQVIASQHVVTKRERDHWISQYDGAIAYLDSQLGALFAHLNQLNRYDKSLIVITSDHGEAFGERNVVGHALFAYQNQVHVPLLVKYPGQKSPRIVSDIVSGVDIFATVLDVAGLPVPQHVQGQSLASFAGDRHRYVFVETFPNERLPDPVSRFHTAERAIFDWPLKYISSTGGKRELYDLSDDPNEERNLFAVKRLVAGTLGEDLDNWLKTVTQTTMSRGIVDKATSDRLKSLGYIK